MADTRVAPEAWADWRARAADLVAAWDSRWLLVELMPRHHRAEARDDLTGAVAAALFAAAASGLDGDADDPDLVL